MTPASTCDVDGTVDGLDYLLWAGNYGSHKSTSMPEPSLASLLLMTAVVLLVGGRTWRWA
ncbi:MAG: hypothetical protein KDA63_15165 [Planctomycetales bacterium]|nr:hypothetical protein [Planctomycetales bacterium]